MPCYEIFEYKTSWTRTLYLPIDVPSPFTTEFASLPHNQYSNSSASVYATGWIPISRRARQFKSEAGFPRPRQMDLRTIYKYMMLMKEP